MSVCLDLRMHGSHELDMHGVSVASLYKRKAKSIARVQLISRKSGCITNSAKHLRQHDLNEYSAIAVFLQRWHSAKTKCGDLTQ